MIWETLLNRTKTFVWCWLNSNIGKMFQLTKSDFKCSLTLSWFRWSIWRSNHPLSSFYCNRFRVKQQLNCFMCEYYLDKKKKINSSSRCVSVRPMGFSRIEPPNRVRVVNYGFIFNDFNLLLFRQSIWNLFYLKFILKNL